MTKESEKIVEDFILMGLNYDQWMNVSAGVGILFIFLCYWLPHLGWLPVNGWAIYMGKFIGFGFVLLPLATRWFFSESLILLLSCIIIMVATFFLFLRRRGI